LTDLLETLREYLAKFGKIEKIKLCKEESLKPYGFVLFSEEGPQEAMTSIGIRHLIGSKSFDCKPNLLREEILKMKYQKKKDNSKTDETESLIHIQESELNEKSDSMPNQNLLFAPEEKKKDKRPSSMQELNGQQIENNYSALNCPKDTNAIPWKQQFYQAPIEVLPQNSGYGVYNQPYGSFHQDRYYHQTPAVVSGGYMGYQNYYAPQQMSQVDMRVYQPMYPGVYPQEQFYPHEQFYHMEQPQISEQNHQGELPSFFDMDQAFEDLANKSCSSEENESGCKSNNVYLTLQKEAKSQPKKLAKTHQTRPQIAKAGFSSESAKFEHPSFLGRSEEQNCLGLYTA